MAFGTGKLKRVPLCDFRPVSSVGRLYGWIGIAQGANVPLSKLYSHGGQDEGKPKGLVAEHFWGVNRLLAFGTLTLGKC